MRTEKAIDSVRIHGRQSAVTDSSAALDGSALIGPISGFPESLPGERIAELQLVDAFRGIYEKYGYAPIETPAVERYEVLTAKGGIQKQIFKLTRPESEASDEDGTGLALHFDLTVPTARYVVQHQDELQFPFRRYQHQKVWRGERAQRGRFREFTQFDIDVVGRNSLDDLHDAEVLVAMQAAFDAIGLDEAEVRVSDRRVLAALTACAGISSPDPILAIIDRAGRDGIDRVVAALAEVGTPASVVAGVSRLLAVKDFGEAREVLVDAGADPAGVDSLERIIGAASDLGADCSRIVTDFSIARGLDYYTGMVVETFVPGFEEWGSVCSGGRYENLAKHFSSRSFPGVGVSIGVSRLFDLLRNSGHVGVTAASPAKVLVTTVDRDEHLHDYLRIARTLREGGFATELYLQEAPLRDQLSDASAKCIPLVVIAGEEELTAGEVAIRLMKHGVQRRVPLDGLAAHVREILAEVSK